VVKDLEAIFGEIPERYEPPRPGDFKGTMISIEKAKKILGYEPKTTFKEGLRRIRETAVHASQLSFPFIHMRKNVNAYVNPIIYRRGSMINTYGFDKTCPLFYQQVIRHFVPVQNVVEYVK